MTPLTSFLTTFLFHSIQAILSFSSNILCLFWTLGIAFVPSIWNSLLKKFVLRSPSFFIRSVFIRKGMPYLNTQYNTHGSTVFMATCLPIFISFLFKVCSVNGNLHSQPLFVSFHVFLLTLLHLVIT